MNHCELEVVNNSQSWILPDMEMFIFCSLEEVGLN